MRRLMQRIALATLAVAAWRASSSSALSNTSTAVFNSGGSGSGSVAGGIIPTINQSRIEVQQVSTVSGIPLWVDPETPADHQTYVSSRGDIWELVMSDEFGNPSRNFTPGMDHLWTSLEKPDGVNGALEFYSHNMSYIKCETAASANLSTSTNSSAVCYLTIEVRDEPSTIRVYNMYSRPPSFQYAKFWYRAAMLQSWNKFCFQGGMLEVRSQLPAAVGAKAKNPDVAKGPFGRAEASAYYPTWPGIWMMGNLGRAIFSGSTNRMWPYSYNECNPKAFDPKSQRINACNSNPGHGLNPNQGRGAPEIDLLEGGGVAISSSIQIGPGLKPKYRRVPANTSIPGDYESCYYSAACSTVGANLPNVPTAVYKKRKYQTWYKGLRYSSNGYCSSSVNDTQTFAEINASLTLGLQENKCTVRTCPGSNDVQSDLSFIDGKKTNKRWGINSKGTCFAIMNNYMGSYLCDPDSTDKMCEKPRNATTPKTNVMDPFNYQMDALSANWGIHVGAYTGFVTYQVEWVMGSTGYIRWMIEGNPIFEIPAQSVVNGPQDKSDPNPQLTFPEEPMYIIFNVALSNQWGARPPNADNPKTKKCRGDGKDPVANRICDSFPMYMKIDYIRLYQDRSANSSMGIGCDPATHPTRQWILDHLDEYEDNDNLFIEVDGRAPCRNDDDCMVPLNRTFRFNTGRCNELKQCECLTRYWGGPRCTTLLQFNDPIEEAKNKRSFGPPLYLTITVGSIAIVLTCLIIGFCTRRRRRQAVEHQQKLEKMKAQMGDIEKSTLLSSDLDDIELSRYANSTPQSKYKNIAGKGA